MPLTIRAVAKTAAAITAEITNQADYFDAFDCWESGIERIYEVAAETERLVLDMTDWHALDWYETTSRLAEELLADFESPALDIAYRVLQERREAIQ